MEILVQGDPETQRVFVALEANPGRLPQVSHEGAHALARFLLHPSTQRFLLDFATNGTSGTLKFYPI
jgi:ABC-type tungstate transport system permease subunit